MKQYNITRFRIPALITSSFMIVVFWIYTLFIVGSFNFGIDFRPGILVTAELTGPSDEQAIRNALGDLNSEVQTAGDEGDRFVIRIADNASVENFQQVTSKAVDDRLNAAFGDVRIIGEEYIGASFSAKLATQTIWVTLIALVLILLYIWIRFKLNYAVSAIVAVFHDILFLLGVIGAFQLEFSTATIAALLTIIGYSLNDTIVIFDRVRENSRIAKDKSFRDIIDISISQSLSRTLITSLTTLLAVLAILLFASGTIQVFALSLAVGVFVGTYSSIFIASPVLLAWHERNVRSVHEAFTGSAHSAEVSKASMSPRPAPIINAPRQTAEEIAIATEKKARSKAKKKKKKK